MASTNDAPREVKALDFTKPPHLPLPSIAERVKGSTEHQSFPRGVYKIIRPLLLAYWSTRFFYDFVVIPSALFIFLCIIRIPISISLLICLPLFGYLFYNKNKFLNVILDRKIGHEFCKVKTIKDEPVYKNPVIIWKLWSTSPLRNVLLGYAIKAGLMAEDDAKHAIRIAKEEPQNSIPVAQWDRPEEMTFYQPVEGFCGPATLNTLLRSIDGAEEIPLSRWPGPVTMAQYGNKLLEENALFIKAAKGTIKSISSYYIDKNVISLEQFKKEITRANDSKFRVMINFLRAPLFYTEPFLKTNRVWSLFGGHWSVVCAVDLELDIALVCDVNDSYGPFIVNLERLYYACFTRDGNHYRGLSIAELN